MKKVIGMCVGVMIAASVQAGVQPFVGVSGGFSQAESQPELLFSDASTTVRSGKNIGYQLRAGVEQLLSGQSYRVGAEIDYDDMGANKWGFLDDAVLAQTLRGFSVLVNSHYRLKHVTLIAKAGVIDLHQVLGSSGLFSGSDFTVSPALNNWRWRALFDLGAEVPVTNSITVSATWQHIFGHKASNVQGSSGTPTVFDPTPWVNPPSINSVWVGVNYLF